MILGALGTWTSRPGRVVHLRPTAEAPRARLRALRSSVWSVVASHSEREACRRAASAASAAAVSYTHLTLPTTERV